ncbi:unnamed protein product, partial [marine sediment metagenome]
MRKIGGQYNEDEVVLDYFKGKPHGFVVDVGAGDGVRNSNTFCLVWKRWSGILIEPEP